LAHVVCGGLALAWRWLLRLRAARATASHEEFLVCSYLLVGYRCSITRYDKSLRQCDSALAQVASPCPPVYARQPSMGRSARSRLIASAAHLVPHWPPQRLLFLITSLRIAKARSWLSEKPLFRP
jgi:hypothetical protein